MAGTKTKKCRNRGIFSYLALQKKIEKLRTGIVIQKIDEIATLVKISANWRFLK
ncbi:MAG: hypothetical protein ACTSPT_01975 [Candidatus Heimdallarchaeota archaeon]